MAETMKTQVYHVNPAAPEPAAIAAAAAVIRAGRLVAFPTETVYGLGANAHDPAAVARIFAAKERPFADPLIVHLTAAEQLEFVCANPSPLAWTLAAAFWPGPLTLVLRRGAQIAANVAGGRETVAVRVPAHPVAHALLAASGVPIAAPSANRFSHPSPTTAQHVLEDLDGRIDLVLDGGATTIGLESTVVDLTSDPPRLLRPGGVAAEALYAYLPDLHVPSTPNVARLEEGLIAPGTLLRHYSPRARVLLVRGESAAFCALARAAVAHIGARRLRIGLVATDEDLPGCADLPVTIASLGAADDYAALARNLFAQLRSLDAAGVDLILAREIAVSGLGRAVRDRLFRAAEGVTVGDLRELQEQIDRGFGG
jgi:L-threonylcarbamoyladenylate synthase